jgi:hypothetical protein
MSNRPAKYRGTPRKDLARRPMDKKTAKRIDKLLSGQSIETEVLVTKANARQVAKNVPDKWSTAIIQAMLLNPVGYPNLRTYRPEQHSNKDWVVRWDSEMSPPGHLEAMRLIGDHQRKQQAERDKNA